MHNLPNNLQFKVHHLSNTIGTFPNNWINRSNFTLLNEIAHNCAQLVFEVFADGGDWAVYQQGEQLTWIQTQSTCQCKNTGSYINVVSTASIRQIRLFFDPSASHANGVTILLVALSGPISQSSWALTWGLVVRVHVAYLISLPQSKTRRLSWTLKWGLWPVGPLTRIFPTFRLHGVHSHYYTPELYICDRS